MPSAEISFFVLTLDELLPKYEETFPLQEEVSAPVELANALAKSRPLRGSNSLIAVREAPAAIAIVTAQDQEVTPLMRVIADQVADMLKRARFVTWEEVNDGVERLAQRLREELGKDFIDRASYVAIPRGGHVVLGLLAYALNLRPEQLDGRSHPGGIGSPLVVVDDCALTGLRFRELMAGLAGDEVVFGTLFSPAALRDAIVAAEPRVTSCVSAFDLVDFTDQMPEIEKAGWRERWRQRGEIYWTGQPDHIVFPWREPEVAVWNPMTEKVVPGWRIAPPSLCLANRVDADSEGHGAEVQTVDVGRGVVRLSDSALYASMGEDVAILDTDDGRAWKLDGVSAVMWKALMNRPSLKSAAAEVASRFQVDESTVQADVEEFVEDLRSLGFVTLETR